MTYILFAKYSIITFAFIPLFIFIVARMKQTFPPAAFKEIRFKTIFLFTLYTLFLVFRLVVYIYIRLFYPARNVDTEIPLYFTEVFMAFITMYMLVTTSFTGETQPDVEAVAPKKLKKEKT